MIISAKFTGDDADQHVLPALQGAQSLDGVARSLTIVTHFAVTGVVRKRHPFDSPAKLYMQPAKSGSFESLFEIALQKDTVYTTTLWGTVSVGILSAAIFELMKVAFRRAVGGSDDTTEEVVRRVLETRGGDIEALSDAIAPSLTRAHTVINQGANSLIIAGDNNIVTFNERTKSYITTTIKDNNHHAKVVSCGMLNANTRNGRVYDESLGRTVAIHIPRTADPDTMAVLARSLQRYASRRFSATRSQVMIRYTLESDIEGNPKRYVVYGATETE